MAAEDLDQLDIEKIRGGDVHAFNGLVRRWQKPMLNLAFRFCRERSLAEDLVQDIFVKVYKNLSAFDGRSKFSTWLFTVATRTLITQTKRYRPRWLFFDDEPATALVDPGPDAGEDDERLRRLVLTLPEPYRSSLILFYFHEQRIDEAAASLGVAPGTLKSRLSRGRALLERRLKEPKP